MNRRQALGMFGAAAVAMPLPIHAADAAILRTVAKLLANEAALAALGDQRLTIADEMRTQGGRSSNVPACWCGLPVAEVS